MMREMKDSGIKWVGQIPLTWNVVSNRYLFDISKRIVADPTGYQLLSLTTKGIKEKDPEDTKGKVPENYNGYQVVEPNDLVMCLFDLDCSAVFSGLSKYRGMISPAYKVLKVNHKEATERYYNYWFQFVSSERFYKQYSKSLRYTVNSDEFELLKSVVPPLDEQKKIADFLDKKCGEIDSISQDVQKQVEVLEEYKRSSIIEAVTHGLNPSAPMKDSGIRYIGKIPAHWDMHPVYTYFKEGKKQNKRNQETNLLSLSYGNIIRKDINTNGGLLPASFSTYNIVEKDDIIIRPTDLQNDKRSLRTGLVKERGIITSAYIDLVPNPNVNSAYYHYLLHALDVKKVFYNMGNGVRQGLNYSEFSKLMLLTPPQAEQKEIADYLDKKCSEIDSIIADKKAQLETIEKYKKSLIYEYVTGKKEVINE